MRGHRAVAFARTEYLGDGADADRGTDVDVADDGRAADVVPVGVIGGELFRLGGLHDVHPLGDL